MGGHALGARAQRPVSSIWHFLTTSANWWGNNGILSRAWAHLRLSVLSVTVAALIAVPLGVWTAHWRRNTTAAVAIVNIGRAIPSFALLALVFPISLRYGFGLGFWPTTVAMIALALPPIFISTFTGIRNVEPASRDAAQGMGMSRWGVVSRVEFPLALPVIFTGLRIAAMQVIATATLGALVAFNGLGSFIEEGRASFDSEKYLGGAFVVTAVALVVESLVRRGQRLLTPWVNNSR